jgi:hypothetical protein
MARPVTFVAATTMLCLGLARVALAAEPEQAEEAFQRGRALLAERRYAEACLAFEESQVADPASGTLLALAYCQELSGLLASAWANYRAAAELAQNEGHAERRAVASDQSRALADRVSVLTIVVPPSLSGNAGLRVTLDGAEIAHEKFGTAMPVNGGTYRVEAAIGQASWSATVTVGGERDKKTLVIELLPPRRVEPAAPASTAPQLAANEQDSGGSRALQNVGLATAIAGVATVGVGLGFGLVASSKHHASRRDGHCDETGCDAKGMELENAAISAARVSTWCVIGGSVVAVGGVALYFGAKSGQRDVSARLETIATPRGAHLVYKGAF